MDDASVPVDAAVGAVIRDRRTSLLVDPDRPVPAGVVEELIEAATWAPNHKRTWPWRFTVVAGGARRRLGEGLAAVAPSMGLPPEKVAKLPGKYARSPVVLLVWVAAADDPVRAREDRDATAAAVQNLLLAATSMDLASYWASVPEVLHDAVRRFARVDEDHDLVALVYLGWPVGTVPAPARPEPVVEWIE